MDQQTIFSQKYLKRTRVIRKRLPRHRNLVLRRSEERRVGKGCMERWRETIFSRDWSSDVCSYDLPWLYEGAVCGSIPILRNLEEYYDNDLISSIEGIFNGSTNYLLTKVFEENKSYSEALAKAQELGFAEIGRASCREGVHGAVAGDDIFT